MFELTDLVTCSDGSEEWSIKHTGRPKNTIGVALKESDGAYAQFFDDCRFTPDALRRLADMLDELAEARTR